MTTTDDALAKVEHAINYAKELGLSDDDYVEICPSRLSFWKELRAALEPRPDVVEVPREVLLQVYGAVGPYYPSENMLTSPLNDAARALQPYVTEGK